LIGAMATQEAASRRREPASLARGVLLVACAVAVIGVTRFVLGPPRPDQAEVRRAEGRWPESVALPSGAPPNSTFLWIYTWERFGLIYPWWEDHSHRVAAASDSGTTPAPITIDELRVLELRGFQDSIGAARGGPLRELSPLASYSHGSTSRRVLTAGIIGDVLVLGALGTGAFGLHACLRGAIGALRSRRRARRGLCLNCAYPRPASGAVCPECGAPVAMSAERPGVINPGS